MLAVACVVVGGVGVAALAVRLGELVASIRFLYKSSFWSVRMLSVVGNFQMQKTLAGVQGRYASALFQAALKTKSTDQVSRDVGALASLLAKEPRVLAFLRDPLVPKTAKLQCLPDMLQNPSALVKNTLAVLADNNRLGLLPSVLAGFNSLKNDHLNVLLVTITSAQVFIADTAAGAHRPRLAQAGAAKERNGPQKLDPRHAQPS